MKKNFAQGLIIFIIAFLITNVNFVNADSFNVSVIDDELDSDTACTDDPADCSLREAITEANNHSGDDTIILPAGDYKLSIAGTSENKNATGDLDINDQYGKLTIQGNDYSDTIIDGDTIDRIFEVKTDAEINNVTIQNGSNVTSGGGLKITNGQVDIQNSVLKENVSDSRGGAIYNTGNATNIATLNIENTTFIGNKADSYGGAIFNNSDTALTINNVNLWNNTAGSNGGAIYNNDQNVIIISSNLSNNEANSGGAIENDTGSVTIDNSVINSNIANYSGGAISNYTGVIEIINHSKINKNINYGSYGGCISNGGDLYIYDSELVQNESTAGS